MTPSVTRLLRALVDGDAAALESALHDDVAFVQGDGTEHRGRDAVLAMFTRTDDAAEARYAVVAEHDAAVTVELTIPGVPGALRFGLHGELRGARLALVRVHVG